MNNRCVEFCKRKKEQGTEKARYGETNFKSSDLTATRRKCKIDRRKSGVCRAGLNIVVDMERYVWLWDILVGERERVRLR